MTGPSVDSRTRPFQLTPDPRFFYCGPTHREVLYELLSAIEECRAPIVLIGQSGTGKTALIHKALLKLPPQTSVVFLRYTTLNADDLIETLAAELGVATEGSEAGGAMVEVRHALWDAGRRERAPLVIVDEAQNLCEVGLRTLCELAWDELIRLVVVGQGQLRDRVACLRAPEPRTSPGVVLELNTLPMEEVRGFVRHRLKVAGESPEEVFPSEAYRLIFEHTSGNPGRINTLCERALKFDNPDSGAHSRIEALRIAAASLEQELAPEVSTSRTAEQTLEDLEPSMPEERSREGAEMADAVDQRPAGEAPSHPTRPGSLFGPSKRYTALTLGAMLVLIALTSWLIEVQFADDGTGMAAPSDDLLSLRAQVVVLNEVIAKTSATQDALLEEVAALRTENRELRNEVDATSVETGQLGAWQAPVIEDFALLETALPVTTEPTPVTHRVRAGDTLYGIARRNRLAVGDLARWNGLDADRPLLVGDRLVLSPREELSYTVRWGDTLTGLKRRFDVSLDDLRRWNDLPTDGRLYAGQRLRIYVGSSDEL